MTANLVYNSLIKAHEDWVSFFNTIDARGYRWLNSSDSSLIVSNTTTKNAKLSNCCFNNTNFINVKFEEVDFSNSNFTNSILEEVDFDSCNLKGCRFSYNQVLSCKLYKHKDFYKLIIEG